MRYLSILLLSFLLTACSSVEKEDLAEQTNISSNINVTKKNKYQGTAFSKYLKDYLEKNINARSRTSRSLIDRSGIESNGRLPSQALYQSLGYQIRDPFVALPPELSTRGMENPEEVLLAQMISDLETTWALLDTTKERLRSQGGLEKGRQDWEVIITRKNLLAEAVGYWYRMRNQRFYDTALKRIGDETNTKFDEITQARKDFDVEDLRDRELALLGIRSDVALMFQFYSSEQARLFNRIDSRELSDKGRRKFDFSRTLQCGIDSVTEAQGSQLLQAKYKPLLSQVENNKNKKEFIYQLNQLARNVSSKALELHAEQLKKNEKEFLNRKEIAEQKRQQEISSLTELEDLIVEKKKKDGVESEEITKLREKPLGIERKPLIVSKESKDHYQALVLLSSWVADELASLNQKRLSNVINQNDEMYVHFQESLWQKASADINVIRDLLYEVYDFTIIDHLIGYERIAFANKVMLYNCELNSLSNDRSTRTDIKYIDQFASVIETSAEQGLSRTDLNNAFNGLPSIKNSINSKGFGDGYKKKQRVIKKQKEKKNQITKSLKQIKKEVSWGGFSVASKQQATQYLEGDGFTVEVGAFTTAMKTIDMAKRFKVSVPKLIYLSKEYDNDGSVVMKVLIGKEVTSQAAENLKGRIGFGKVKKYSEVRQDISEQE